MSKGEQYRNTEEEYALSLEDDQPNPDNMMKDETFKLPYTKFAKMIGLSNKDFRAHLSEAEKGEINSIIGKNKDEFVFDCSKEYDTKPNVLIYKEYINIYVPLSDSITYDYNTIVTIKNMDTYIEFIKKYPEFGEIALKKISEQNERGKDRKRIISQLTPDEEEQAGYIIDLLKNINPKPSQNRLL